MKIIVKSYFLLSLATLGINIAHAQACEKWFEIYQHKRLALSEENAPDKKIQDLDTQREGIFQQCELEARQGIVSAQTTLARLFFNGIGADRSMSDAHYWYILAAKNGSKEGAIVIANSFLYGGFFHKDMYNSYYWNLVARKELKSFEPEFCDSYIRELKKEEILMAERAIKAEYGLTSLPSCVTQ